MLNARRLFSILDSSASDMVETVGDIATSHPAVRAKSKLDRLTALFFGLKRSKLSSAGGRGTGSLDLSLDIKPCRNHNNASSSHAPAIEVPFAATTRRSESRVLPFLGGRRSDASALMPSTSTTTSTADNLSVSSPSDATIGSPSDATIGSPHQRAAAQGNDSSCPDSSCPASSSGGGSPSGTCEAALASEPGAVAPRRFNSGGNASQLLHSSSLPEEDEGAAESGCRAREAVGGGAPQAAAAAAPPASGRPPFGGADGSQAGRTTLRAEVLVAAASGGSAADVTVLRVPAAPPAPLPPLPQTQLLATCPALPDGMRRSCWCLEDYSVTRRLYCSDTASVYAAVCLRSGLPVALKVYSLSRVPANVVHMLIREIKIQSKLAHKNIVMLYGAFQDLSSQRLVLVQEYAPKGSLQGVHRALQCRMSEAQARLLVLRPLLAAVSYLHRLGIVHRDIKPDNLLFGPDWRLLLGDFGVAIDSLEERAVTRAGTVGYMAPEVERCPLKVHPHDNKLDPSLAYTTAADIWGIGCLTYLLLLGFPPYITAAHDCEAGIGNAGGGDVSGGDRGYGGSGGGSRAALIFPGSTSPLARDFISLALAERPEDRPTARQLLRHPWFQLP